MSQASSETPVLDLMTTMTAESIQTSSLDAQELMLVRIAALVAVDAPPSSYVMNLGAASEVGLEAEDVRGILAAIAPIVGTPRVVSARRVRNREHRSRARHRRRARRARARGLSQDQEDQAKPRRCETMGEMTATEDVFAGLELQSFWSHFRALTTIARPSRAEEPVIEHVRAWAAGHGYELHQDSGRNLVIRVPATPGRESAPTLILQGHLDMVCERDPASPNDPAEGGSRCSATATG